MPDLYTGVVIGFICGVFGSLGWASWTVRKSKAIRRRNLADLDNIFSDY